MRLGKIALALSGGGYRASGFHLGTLECLDKLGLLDDVKVLSTISGGTFTGAAYAIARANKKSFGEFCDWFALKLEQTNVIETALGRLIESRQSAVDASLICAAARVYDDLLFHNAFFEGKLLREGNFADIAFNSTEFVYGLSFRFALSSTGAVIGNKYFTVPQAAAEKIRISDIVAASSCFPGGFEPILFPHQFRFKDGVIPEELRRMPEFDKRIPLMDGGIYDNQGISSVLLAHQRKPDAFDLLLISDTDQSGDEIYRDLGPRKISPVKFRYALFFLKFTFVLSLTSAVMLVASLWKSGWNGFSTFFLQVVPLITTLFASVTIGYGWFRWHEFRKGLDPRIAGVLLKDLGKLSLPEVIVFARNRVCSVLAMALSIFMKRIRDLSRSEAQELQNNPQPQNRDPEADSGDLDAQKRGNPRVVETRIVKIPGQGKLTPFKPVVGWLTPSPEMLAVTNLGKKVGTQLWFNASGPDNAEKIMRALRLSGKITLCASLLQHLLRDRQEPGGTPDAPKFTPELDAVFLRAREYWGELKTNAGTFQ